MALFENFPYTNLHELNLDWLIQEMKDLEQKVQDGPVVSVNGLTGVVTLYRESNIQFPDITDPTVTKWEMFRYLNGNIYGIQFDNNGNVYALRDFARTKLLTWDDIPPEAGVISINDLYGVVHLSGTDIPYMGGETATVYDKLSDLDDDITSAQADINELSVTLTTVDNAIKRGIAYLESTDTAVNNIPSGRYVFWKNGAYISTSAISVGDTLSSTNLTAVATGGFINALQAEIDSLNNKIGKIISSGSLHDITEPGIYWLTSAVTDKPEPGAGTYIISTYSSSYLSGLFISADNDHLYTIKFGGEVWEYEYLAFKKTYTVTATTSGTGAIPVADAYKQYTFVGGHLSTGGPGFVVRRDNNFYTVFDNNGSPMANTAVEFIAVFIS